MFTSKLYKGERIIDVNNAPTFEQPVMIDGNKVTYGRVQRDLVKYPFGATPFLKRFPFPKIPRSEWPARIQEINDRKQLLSERLLNLKIPSLNQQQTNFCWGNGPTGSLEDLRVRNRLPHIRLSPASVCAPVRGYRNQGGWGGEWIEYASKNGVCSADVWPVNAIDRSLDNAKSQANRKLFIITEWYELTPRDFDEVMTALLLGFSVAVGYNWWGHEVRLVDPMYFGGTDFGARFRNSWGDSFGHEGFDVLHERKATPDDAVIPASSIPTARLPTVYTGPYIAL